MGDIHQLVLSCLSLFFIQIKIVPVWKPTSNYLADGTLIESFETGGLGNCYYSGCTIYMKKGEYVTINKEANIELLSSKFWYAEGEQPVE